MSAASAGAVLVAVIVSRSARSLMGAKRTRPPRIWRAVTSTRGRPLFRPARERHPFRGLFEKPYADALRQRDRLPQDFDLVIEGPVRSPNREEVFERVPARATPAVRVHEHDARRLVDRLPRERVRGDRQHDEQEDGDDQPPLLPEHPDEFDQAEPFLFHERRVPGKGAPTRRRVRRVPPFP